MTVRPAKTQISLGIRPVWSESSLSAWRNLECLSTQWAQAKTLIRLGGCPGWSESSVGAHSFCLFCHVVAHIYFAFSLVLNLFLHAYIDYRCFLLSFLICFFGLSFLYLILSFLHAIIWITSRENLIIPYANNKGADQPEQAGLSLTWSQLPKTGFLVTRLIWYRYHV